VVSAKSRKCEATNDEWRMFAALRRNSHMLPAEHSAEFFGRTSAFAELRPISSLCLLGFEVLFKLP